MGKVDKGIDCSVEGCLNKAVRSLAFKKASEAGLKLKKESRRAYLCEDHYREFKKARRSMDKIERMRWKPW
ncbi:MAG: hypothetical protein QXJ72_06170 [Thermoproteota archaeon]